VFEEVRRDLPTPRHFLRAGRRTVARVIRPLGLAWRAGTLVAMSRVLVDRHGGEVPDDPEELRALPGVGPYAAAAFESLHLGRRSPILDGNVVRLYGRLFGLRTGPETRRSRQFLEMAEHMTPARGVREFNYAMLDFTRGVCTARPKCDGCPLRDGCVFGRSIESDREEMA